MTIFSIVRLHGITIHLIQYNADGTEVWNDTQVVYICKYPINIEEENINVRMKVGIISDIHGNKVALDKVLSDMNNIEHIICCGDVVGYGPKPRECVEVVREKCDAYVRGNHDRNVANPGKYRAGSGVYEGLVHAKEELTEEQLEWVTNLDRKVEFNNYQVVHSHPDVVDRYVYPSDFGDVSDYIDDEDGLLLGHTHYQHAEMQDGSIIMNPGSVGQPRDGDARAAYGIIESEDNSYDTHRVEYDIQEVQDQIEEAGLPTKNGLRLEKGE